MSCQQSASDPRAERIHAASLTLLERYGFQLGSAELVDFCRRQGLKTADNRVYCTAAEVERAVALVPDRFRLLARNPARTLDYQPGRSFVGLGRSAAFVHDEDGERRQATAADYIEMMQLAQQLDEIELVGNLVTPADIGPDRVFRFMMAAQIRYSDKPYHLLHPTDLALLAAAFEVETEALILAGARGESYAHTTVNTLSPLAISPEQCELLMTMATHNIAINISPAPAMGSSSPCSVAGTLALNNAEVLAVLVLAQHLQPGLPVLYGVFPAGTDMRTMAATYGSAEARILEAGAVMMARRYGLLTRGNVGQNESFACDFQAGAEAMLNFGEAMRQGISYLPGCGLLASFAGASKVKLVLDAELAAIMRRLHQPWQADDDELAIDLIGQVGPRGSFITRPHTFARCRSELYHPQVFCRGSYEKWREGEGLRALAAQRAARLIAEFRNPPLPVAVEQRLALLAGD